MVTIPDAARRVRALRTDQASPREWYRIVDKADTGTDSAEILIYDEIDPFWGISAGQFVKDLAGIDADSITVRINSPGGDVYEGIAILNALRGAEQTITTVVDGIAASAASFIAMAGDEIVMMPNSELMIHDAWALSIGNAQDMQDAADNLNRISDNLASIYAERAGGTAEEWRAVMQTEAWYSAQEAVDAGLATRVAELEKSPAAAAVAATLPRNSFDLSIFAYAGRRAAPAPQSPSAAEAEVNKKEDATMASLNDSVIERLGLPADADEDAILAALDEKLAPAEVEQEREPSPADLSAAAAKHGMKVVDSATLTQLTADAAAGREAKNRLEASDRESLVAKALADGKIPPAREEHWLTQAEHDFEGTKAYLDSLPKGLIPVDGERGYGQAADDTDIDAYTALYGKEA